jgi:bisphosphoglycerate-independent phosphoglycerate mutase (AlkP superfamily)
MLDAVEVVGGIFLITADHGNGEDMVKRNLKTGAPILDKGGKLQVLTSHTCNPVSLSLAISISNEQSTSQLQLYLNTIQAYNYSYKKNYLKNYIYIYIYICMWIWVMLNGDIY